METTKHISPSVIIQKCMNGEGTYNKEQFISLIDLLLQEEFNDFCNAALSDYEFFIKYSGRTVTDSRALIDKYDLEKTKSQYKKYSKEYVEKNLSTLESASKLIADTLEAIGNYDKLLFMQKIENLNDNDFYAFCEKLRRWEQDEISQRNTGIIDDKSNTEIGERDKWRIG